MASTGGLQEIVKVRTLVMVATPNAGAALAEPDHLSSLLDRIINLVQFSPETGVADFDRPRGRNPQAARRRSLRRARGDSRLRELP